MTATGRTVAQAHAELLRVTFRAPLAVLGLPVLAGLPGLLADALGPEDLAGYLAAPRWILVQLAVMAAGWVLSTAVSTFIQASVMDPSGGSAGALRRTARVLGPVLQVSAVSGAAVLAGLVTLLVPGVLVLMRTWFVVPVVLATGETGPWKVMKASSAVYGRGPWRTQGLLTVVGVVWGLPALLLPHVVDGGPWGHLLASLPGQAAWGLLAVATALLHEDITAPRPAAPGRSGAGMLLGASVLSAVLSTWMVGSAVTRAVAGASSLLQGFRPPAASR